MKLEKNLTDSMNYTRLLFMNVGRLLILIILDLIPIVNLIVVGYMSRVVKEPQDSKELPPLEGYLGLWIQGLKIIVAVVIYMIIPIILFVPFIFLTIVAWMAFPVIGWLVTISMLIIGVLLAFFLAILLAMAIVNMVRKDSFGAAFAFSEILSVIRRVGWGIYIIWLLVLFVCSIIVGAIGSIPFIGWILAAVIGPLFGVFIARSASLTYMEGASAEAENSAIEKPEEPGSPEAPK